MFLLLGVDPISPFLQGPAAAILACCMCVALFIWSQIEVRSIGTKVEGMVNTVNTAVEKREEWDREAHDKLIERFNMDFSVIKSNEGKLSEISKLCEIIIHSEEKGSQDHRDLLAHLNTLLQDHKVLAANQLSMMTGMQEIVGQLITAIRE